MIPHYDQPGAHGEHVPTHPDHYPGMTALKNYLLGHFHPTTFLGQFANRSIRGGKSTSLHAVSRAIDIGWTHRSTADAMLNWCVGHAAIGIQALHDYQTTSHQGGHQVARTWGHGRGWHWGRVGSYGGHWIHVELNIDAARNQHLLTGAHPPQPAHQKYPNHTQHLGSHNHDVALLQVGLRAWHHADHRVDDPGNADSKFGPRTERSLKAWQTIFGHVTADGIYGPVTHLKWVQIGNYLEAVSHH